MLMNKTKTKEKRKGQKYEPDYISPWENEQDVEISPSKFPYKLLTCPDKFIVRKNKKAQSNQIEIEKEKHESKAINISNEDISHKVKTENIEIKSFHMTQFFGFGSIKCNKSRKSTYLNRNGETKKLNEEIFVRRKKSSTEIPVLNINKQMHESFYHPKQRIKPKRFMTEEKQSTYIRRKKVLYRKKIDYGAIRKTLVAFNKC